MFSAKDHSCVLQFHYLQHGLNHATRVSLSGPGNFSCDSRGVECQLDLQPAQSLFISVDVQPTFEGTIVRPLRRQSDGPAWCDQCSRLETGSPVIQAAWDRAAADLQSLQLFEGEGEERFTPAAGVPKYLGLFGRDALVTALQASLLNSGMLRGTLRTLARWIARDYDDKHDAQPGKVLHQRQLGPLALLGRTPFLHYYGDHSAPALFVIGVAWDLAQTGELPSFRSMRNTVLDVLAWMDRDGDRPDKQQVRSIASNAGACLAYGIIDDDKVEPVIQRLLCADLFSGWGIRSLSSNHPAYNPFAYHLGSVWPSPTAIIARGMQRYGSVAALHQLAGALISATELFAHNRLPEVFGGNPRDTEHPHPGLYPGGCAPQAWSAAAIIGTVSALLGVTPTAPRRILMVDPNLPEWLPEVTLRQLRIGDAAVSLRFHRDAARYTHYEVADQTGSLRILRLPPAQNSELPVDRLAPAFRGAG